MYSEIEEIEDEILIKIIYDEKSYISGTIYLRDDELYISYFHVDKNKRGKGIGMKLLNNIIKYSKKYGIETVHLVDESERYRDEHNIYIKYGFKYKEGKKMIYNI